MPQAPRQLLYRRCHERHLHPVIFPPPLPLYHLFIPELLFPFFHSEDADFLHSHHALAADRISAIETGGCPHAAVREDISANLLALQSLHSQHATDLLLIESGGDNLAANYSRELADFIIYVIDVAGGDKVPRKGGPGITGSDLLVVNKVCR